MYVLWLLDGHNLNYLFIYLLWDKRVISLTRHYEESNCQSTSSSHAAYLPLMWTSPDVHSECVQTFSRNPFDKLFFFACRTETGGQPSESGQLSDAPLLHSCADSGDFHAHRNKWGGAKVRANKGRLAMYHRQWHICACMDDLADTKLLGARLMMCIPKCDWSWCQAW